MKWIAIGVWGIALAICLSSTLPLSANQVIYVDIGSFDRSKSQFGVEVKGNTWTEVQEKGALHGTAFGAPGDNNHGTDGGEPYLVFRLPQNVQAGESTGDGKTWVAWARMFQPRALLNPHDTGANSFFMRTSTDAASWTPATRGDTSLRWNDPGTYYPASINGVDVLATDADPALPWFWQAHSSNGQSTIDPKLAVGVNYIELGPRESDVTDFPRIDVVCLRNDGGLPSDAEALASVVSVEPQDKLSLMWAVLKNQ